jgi:DNA-binding beta-propeller fold protein YncE
MLLVSALAALTAAWPACVARAADRVYWTNYNGFKISFANLDASDAGDLATSGATVYGPDGVALDPAAGRIYWANVGAGANKISFANLNGSGGGDLAITGATVSTPIGVAVDPAAGRIYWSNFVDKLSFANLDGSGGGDLTTTGATVSDPQGVVLDPAAGRIYWANAAGNKLSFAKLDSSGGGDLTTTGATVNQPAGVALDLAAGRIYWANAAGGKLSFANLNGSGGGDLIITGATVSAPSGVALDLAAGRIYWTNRFPDKLSFANLDGSGGGDLTTLTATLDQPSFLALLKRPSATGAPAVTGGSTTGSTLSCSQGSWAPDLVPALLYRSPQSFTFQWSLGGAEIAGATQGSITASSPGDYSCQVTATNEAGSASQTSASHPVSQVTFGGCTLVTFEFVARQIPARGPLKVGVANANDFEVTGTLSGETVSRVSVARERRLKLKAKAFSVAAHAEITVQLKLRKVLRRLLRRHKRDLRLTATFGDTAGHTCTVTLP